MQADAEAADDRDERVPGRLQLAQYPFDQLVDRRGRVVSEVAARLPAAFGDGVGAGFDM